MSLERKIDKMIENNELEKEERKHYERLQKERKAYEEESKEYNDI